MPANEVWYTFRAGGIDNEISITSANMNGIQIVAYVGDDCDNLQARACDVGVGNVTVSVTVTPGTNIFFFVSGEDATDSGDFDIAITGTSLCEACYTGDNAFITLTPLNPTGVYSCGSAVNVCFTLTEWLGNASQTAEWLHSIVPTFGAGWDVGSVTNIVVPPSCDGQGAWGWYPGGWTGCNTGDTFDYGFAYESTGGVNGGCAAGPGNNWGDGDNGCINYPTPVQWCWTMNVADCSDTFTGEDMSVNVQVFSDGDSGSWTQTGCNSGASFEVLASVVVCLDDDPIAAPTNVTCPGADDGTLTFEANGGLDPGGAYNFRVTFPDGSVNVCNGCTGVQFLDNLPPGQYNIEALNLSSSCPRSVFVDIDEDPAPGSDATADHTFVCPGQGPIELLGTTGASGTIVYTWTGPNGFMAAGQNVFTNDPADEGVYTLVVTVDGCPGPPVDVDVEYPIFAPTIEVDNDNTCFGEEITFTVLDGGTDFQWFDPSGNQVGTNSSTLTTTTTGNGIQTYSVDVTEGTCTIILTLDIFVAPEILGGITMNPNGQVCEDSDIVFTVVDDNGFAFPGSWTYSWTVDGGPEVGTDATLTVNEGNSGNYTVEVLVISNSGCEQTFAEPFIVNDVPVVTITPQASVICADGSVTLTANPSGGDGNYTFLWGPNESDNITTQTQIIDINSPEMEALYVIVTDGNGCQAFSDFADVIILPELQAVTFVDCNIGTGEITFSWNDVGQTHFEIYIEINGGGEVLIDDMYAGLTYTETGLTDGSTVTIRVVSVGEDQGVACIGPDNVQACSLPNCADPAFTLDLTEACADNQDIVLTLDDVFVPGTVYTLTVSPAAGSLITDSDASDGTMELSFSDAGTYTITLTTTNATFPECDGMATGTFTLSQPVAIPTVTCGGSGLDFVDINWTDTGAESYVVNIVSIPPGGIPSETGTTFTATGLNAGESVSISVTAIQSGCPPVTSDTIICIAQACINIVPMITTPVDTFCSDGSEMLIDLTVDVPGTGTIVWSGGPGVIGSQFDPVAAGPGPHVITVVYSEGTCDYSSNFELFVIAPVTGVGLVISDSELCEGGLSTISVTGTIPNGYDVEWILPNGSTLSSGILDDPAPIDLFFNTAGIQIVQLAISNGVCPADTINVAVEVFSPVGQITGDCENISFDQVGFAWIQPDGLATDYIVVGMPAGAVLSEPTDTSLLFTGLAEGESVMVQVFAESGTVCPNPDTLLLTCTARSCPMITIDLFDINDFCLDDDATAPLITDVVGSDGSGLLSYLSAPWVVGLDFNSTGLAAGDYQVVAFFNELGCTFSDTITVTINPLPVAAFTLPAGPICINEVVGADAGAMQVGWSYDWTVPAADATVVVTSDTTIDVSWSTPGMKDVTLVVTDNNTCISAPFTTTIEVLDTLSPPVILCGASGLTSVLFSWDDQADANGYEVTITGGATFNQDSTTLTIGGLTEGDVREITVTALGNGPCGNSTATAMTCEAESCPTLIITPPAEASFCFGAADNVTMLSASQMGGAGFGTYVFTGDGVVDSIGSFWFDANAAGVGVHTIDVLYDENTCTGTASADMTVLATPVSDFTLNGAPMEINVCEDEDFLIAYAGPLTAADGATYTWDFVGATTVALAAHENYTAAFATAGTYTVTLSITAAGCPSEVTSLNVVVDAPIAPPVITCTGSDLNSVTFSWGAIPGATGYELGDGTILGVGELSATVSGLLPGEAATITVITLSTDVCGNSVAATSAPCNADDCPTLSLNAAGLTDEVCLLVGNETIDLTAVLVTGGTGNGTYTFSGPGVTGSTFNAGTAGGNEAGETHTITVDYTEEGPCALTGTFDVTVYERPSVVISEPAPACIDQGVSIIIGSTNFDPDQGVVIDFDGGVVQDDGNPNDAVYLVIWNTPGIKVITGTVTSNIGPGCESLPFTREVIIEAPLETPVVSCPATAELEEITFSWGAVAGATGYEVTTNPGGTSTVDDATTTFLVSGLTPETAVAISVIALGDGPCGDSEPGIGACETAPCPGGSVQAVTPSNTFCLDGNQQAFLLEAELNVGTPSGPFVWSGTGVVDNGDGTFSFDPAGLPAGQYNLMVNYLGEANCTSTDAITVDLFDQPSSGFGVTASVVCTDTETIVGLNGTNDPTANYVWDFAGAAQTPTGIPENFNLSWPVAGTYTVSLTVTANGCTTTSSQMITVDPPANAGAPIGSALELCTGNSEVINLNTMIAGQDAGGNWAVAASSPSNTSVDISTGLFDAGQLSTGDYVFSYLVQAGTCPAETSDVGLRLLTPPVADAGEPQTITCTVGMVGLDGSNSESGDGFTYRWFSNDPAIMITGGDQQRIDVGQPGTYMLEVTNSIGCSNTAEVIVTAETEAPVMEIELSNITCFAADDGAILVTGVSGGQAPYTFTLNGEERGQSTLFAGLMAQEYDLQIMDANGCLSNIIIDLTEPDELTIRLQFPGDSTTVASGDEIIITAAINGGNPLDTLMWIPDSISTGEGFGGIRFTATETQMISVTVVDELGCTATDREMLLVRKDRDVYFPNAFSPNGDNINDIWFIGGNLDDIEFIDNFFVFDRWGEAVHTGGQLNVGQAIGVGDDGVQFLPNDPSFGWDGTLKGKEMNPQVLVYTATVHFKDGEKIVYKGDFVLMR